MIHSDASLLNTFEAIASILVTISDHLHAFLLTFVLKWSQADCPVDGEWFIRRITC